MSSELSDNLRNTSSLSNLLLARSIDQIEGRYPICDSKDFEKDEKNRRKAYQLFLKLIDKESSASLKRIDIDVEDLCDFITSESGWWYTENGFMYVDSFHTVHVPDIRVFPVSLVVRKKDGFVPSSQGIEDIQNSLIASREIHFAEYFQKELEMVHGLLCDKEEVVRNCSCKNPKDQKLVRSIIRYLDLTNKRFEEEKKGFK